MLERTELTQNLTKDKTNKCRSYFAHSVFQFCICLISASCTRIIILASVLILACSAFVNDYCLTDSLNRVRMDFVSSSCDSHQSECCRCDYLNECSTRAMLSFDLRVYERSNQCASDSADRRRAEPSIKLPLIKKNF